jgi:hypothetical protein
MVELNSIITSCLTLVVPILPICDIDIKSIKYLTIGMIAINGLIIEKTIGNATDKQIVFVISLHTNANNTK